MSKSEVTCPFLAVLLEIAVHGVSEVEHLGAGNGGVGGAQEALCGRKKSFTVSHHHVQPRQPAQAISDKVTLLDVGKIIKNDIACTW